MIIQGKVGITSYGTSLPLGKVEVADIALAQGKTDCGIAQSLGIRQKTAPDGDEDTTTLATAAAFEALQRWSGEPSEIGALFIGSESHPYAVKPTGTMVKAALGLSNELALADLQFACKAGTQSLQIVAAYIASGLVKSGLAIGADTAQSQPGDILEFTAGAGAAAYLLGSEHLLAKLLATTSTATDTPDFWRRPHQSFPQHAGRFSGEPAYFWHVTETTKRLLKEVNLQPQEIDYCVFHTPNAKFPTAVAHQLGFTPEQMKYSLIVKDIGNTYAAASLLALASVLDQVEAGKKILVTSYGSGAGSDSFLFETTPLLVSRRKKWSGSVSHQMSVLQPISYQTYRKNIHAL